MRHDGVGFPKGKERETENEIAVAWLRETEYYSDFDNEPVIKVYLRQNTTQIILVY